MKMPYSKIKQGWLVFAGYFYLYIVVGNVIGEILVRLGDNEKGVCFPYWGMFGLLTYDCKNILLEYAWGITIGIPRFLIAPTFMFVDMIKNIVKTWVKSGYDYNIVTTIGYYIYIAPFAWITIGLIIIFTLGFLYWNKRSKYISWGMTMLLIIIIFYKGLFTA